LLLPQEGMVIIMKKLVIDYSQSYDVVLIPEHVSEDEMCNYATLYENWLIEIEKDKGNMYHHAISPCTNGFIEWLNHNVFKNADMASLINEGLKTAEVIKTLGTQESIIINF
jgi:hypothetical protein